MADRRFRSNPRADTNSKPRPRLRTAAMCQLLPFATDVGSCAAFAHDRAQKRGPWDARRDPRAEPTAVPIRISEKPFLRLDLEYALSPSFGCVVAKEGIHEDWRTGEAFGIIDLHHPLLRADRSTSLRRQGPIEPTGLRRINPGLDRVSRPSEEDRDANPGDAALCSLAGARRRYRSGTP